MATFTAHILVGSAHPNHGGISPTHHLYLSENSRPAWLLIADNLVDRMSDTPSETITWIPTLENTLEDALLMIALYVVKDSSVRDVARDLLGTKDANSVTLHEDIDEQQLHQLYERSRAADIPAKLVLTVMHGSAVMRQLKVLEKYTMEVEVCVPYYTRSYSRWEGQVVVRGRLDDVLSN